MDVVNLCYFFIDRTENILIADYTSYLYIFNPEFQLNHKIPVYDCPAGVTGDIQ